LVASSKSFKIKVITFNLNMLLHDYNAIWFMVNNETFCNLVCNTKISKPMISLWQIMHHIFGFEKWPLVGYCSFFKKAHINEFQLWSFQVIACFCKFVICKYDTYESSIGTWVALTWCTSPPSYNVFSTIILLSCSQNIRTISSLGLKICIVHNKTWKTYIKLVKSSQLVTKKM
jgi:hypothetical protein